MAICSSSTSHTKICFCTPICGAARAMPESLSYSVSNMSSTRRAILPLMSDDLGCLRLQHGVAVRADLIRHNCKATDRDGPLLRRGTHRAIDAP